MTSGKMHVDEVDTNTSLVSRLLASQFPQWADLPIEPVQSAGTDNAVYRLGNDMAVRLPRIHWAIAQVEKEHHWLPRLASFLPLTIPIPLAKGEPSEGYPWQWSVYRWLEGESATMECIANPRQAATDLAQFIADLQRIDTTGGPLAVDNNLRGIPLAMRDTYTREAIAALDGMIDTDAAIIVWEDALQAPEWDRAPVWFHGDLLPGNLLVEGGRLSAVIDFGGLGVGDPACDLMIAWGLFSGESRDVFRVALGIDDATWARGRGHALSQAVIFIPYYLNTNPVGVSNARRTINAVLADYWASN
ncbi:aminoglycoside phosphotransferase family protein [Chlorogloeopsis sp. ULAP01]|uniref:aminoglycoside phosphotransferase family protein n=1 Tax=Chlorogloeopsis sp. ULAP01 TaxID=3056483 RepID=UPI0025AAD6EF|nr:aminoglycoside phosphotransferase family protein [Chlorogloeopsis sp. ULAP01]MDM9381344.1 aminoglycoside phosphotransferase family protein [Chlorogloeopsis sp. ULAP01]